MKRLITICMMASISLAMFAQATSLTVDNQTPGWLSSKINYGDQTTVRNLKVTGYINATDLKFIGTLIQDRNLDGRLDLSEVNVVGEGTNAKDNYLEVAFFGLSKADTLSYFSLPKSLTELGTWYGLCLDTLVFDTKMQKTGSTFYQTKIKNVIFGNSISTISSYAFRKVPLNSVILPDSLKTLEDFAFNESLTDLSNLKIFPSLEYMGYEVFYQNYNETSNKATLPDTIKFPKIKEYHVGCMEYKEGMHIYLGEDISKIYYDPKVAYSNKWYPSLKNITFHIAAKTPPSTSQNLWNKDLAVYVPKGCGEAYKSHGSWKYANIIEEAAPLLQIILDKHDVLLDIGEECNLSTTLVPNNADNDTIVWRTNDENIVSVTQTGKITAIASGVARITVSSVDGLIKDECVVTVKTHASSIIINPSAITMTTLGETKQLEAQVLPENTFDKSVKWSSSNTTVCTVTQNGTLIATGNGTSVVIAITNDGSIPATCIVTVDTTLSGIDEAIVSEKKAFDVYSVSGVLMRKDVSTLEGLPRGIYIVNGRKVVVK